MQKKSAIRSKLLVRHIASALLSAALLLALPVTAQTTTEQTLDKVVAVANDDVIMASELTLQTNMLAAQIRQSGQQLPPPDFLQRQVLEKLIVESLQLQLAERSGAKVSKEQLDAAIAGIAAQNKMSAAAFQAALAQEGIPVNMFRENVRRQIILQQVQQSFVINRIEISDQDVDSFLQSEDGRRLAIQAAAEKPISQVHARHILIKPSAVRDDEEVQKLLRKIIKAVQNGSDFSALAKKYSEDPGSALKGGDLGWVSAGQVVPEFEAVMNDTPTGSVSEPFRTQFGWHIVQAVERRDQNMSEEILKQQARSILRKRRFQDELPRWLKELRDQAYVQIKI
ncbi:MAG: peptidylprolyl isomerase [Pseudomonadales bacterium]|nr:peptidylprolyl isomerase [Pseudomonadales bacterium]